MNECKKLKRKRGWTTFDVKKDKNCNKTYRHHKDGFIGPENLALRSITPMALSYPPFVGQKILKSCWHHPVSKPPKMDSQLSTKMVVSNAIGIDATSALISLWNLNHFLVFRRAKNTLSIPDFPVILKTLSIWLLARNVACNMWDLSPLISELRFVTISLLCSQTKQLVR